LENNNIVSHGRICVLEDDNLHSQNHIDDQQSNTFSDPLMLDSMDVYKELRVRGYDYGPKFRGIQEIKTENFHKIYARIKWTGNWISFMDSILQMMSVVVPFRKLFVPVIITSLKCDPKLFFDAIEKYKQIIYDEIDPKPETDLEHITEQFESELVSNLKADTTTDEPNEMKKIMEPEIKQLEKFLDTGKEKFVSILPVSGNMHLKLAVTHGIELSNMVAFPISRMNSLQDVKCESYQFIPNEENDAIKTIYKKEITEYLQV